MSHLLTKRQIKLLKTRRSSDGWEYEENCAACEYEMRREFAGDTSFEELKMAIDEARREGTITGDEIDMGLLEKDLQGGFKQRP